MPHADAPHPAPVTTDAFAPHADDQAPAIKDAALMMWIVVGAIAVWSAAVYFLIL